MMMRTEVTVKIVPATCRACPGVASLVFPARSTTSENVLLFDLLKGVFTRKSPRQRLRVAGILSAKNYAGHSSNFCRSISSTLLGLYCTNLSLTSNDTPSSHEDACESPSCNSLKKPWEEAFAIAKEIALRDGYGLQLAKSNGARYTFNWELSGKLDKKNKRQELHKKKRRVQH